MAKRAPVSESATATVSYTNGASASNSVPSIRRNREADVVHAAIDAFYERGYAAASVQDIADIVGVLKGSLYYYITSKEDLLFRIVDNVHDESSAILSEILALQITAVERLHLYVARHVTWYLDNVEAVTIFLRDWRYLTGERLELVEKRRRDYERIVRRLIVAAQSEADVDAGVDPRYASLFILSAVNHAPEWHDHGRVTRREEAKRIAAAYADLTVGTLVGSRPRTRGKPRPARAKA